MRDKQPNIVGKDWLTVTEAAHYCGVSERQFRENAAAYGLLPRRFMGKQLYEKAALYRAISDSPYWAPSSAHTAASTVAGVGPKVRLMRYERRKGI